MNFPLPAIWRTFGVLCGAVFFAVAALPLAPALAQQEPPPFVQNKWEFGRHEDESRLRFCVDRREPDWEVGLEIGKAIAGALLLEPQPYMIDSELIVQELEELFGMMLENCYIHLGFKLLPGVYPQWLGVTRAYYSASYVFVTADPTAKALADLPPSSPIASTLGTSADLRLISYLIALPREKRWPRFPMGKSEVALKSVLNGIAAVALVWEPALWALQRADPAYARLRVIASDPLPLTTEGVGAVVLARETFLRTSLDQAIEALVADGTIQDILDAHNFPATVGSAGSR